MSVRWLRHLGRLFTGVEVLTEAALVLDGEVVGWIGGDGDRPPATLAQRITDEVDIGGGLVTPGLIDAHTHPVYGDPRLAEIATRSAGASTRELGPEVGIPATVRATRAADPGELADRVRQRLARWPAGGATTVEAKTGYHLERAGELAAVDLLHSLRAGEGLPDLAVTFLAAHDLPPEAADHDAYAGQVASWCAEAARRGADACDVFCDAGYFSVAQARRVLGAAAEAGLRTRIHADELERTGGAGLAAELGADSADHLLHAGPEDARALAGAGVVATLCPGTALSLGRLPDVAVLREAGVELALGSDHNPGTCGITSMALVVTLAVTALRLPVTVALRAATAGGARSLGLADRGVLGPGRRADLVWWDADHEGAFAWAWGPRPLRVWRAGTEIGLAG